MTAFDYNASAATVTRLLAKYGEDAVLKAESGTAYDPSTGTNAPTYTPLPTTAAVFAMAQKYINGTTILQGDQTALVDPGVTPKQGDVLTWQGVDWSIIAVTPVAPAGVLVLTKAQIRGN